MAAKKDRTAHEDKAKEAHRIIGQTIAIATKITPHAV
jgi:hypothetical protein